MMTPDQAVRIASLRERLFRCVEDEMRRDGHHKSYEGALDVSLSFPSIFDRANSPEWAITWHCYVVGSGRHHHWTGRTLSDAIAIAENEAEKIATPYEIARFSRDMELLCDEPGEGDGSVTIHGAGRSEEQAP